ncbi:hypothetical protein COCNU_13G003510 [Cocos nucifera]|uniref:Helicase ATP-binding domain-containing protein n=1 Tax=Cocos nucifera TaxID=13894 RepID=A0A8K0ISS5_COCNU|nr:hypothetical protein COCNU_13G003510 [Cocos nucifera]
MSVHELAKGIFYTEPIPTSCKPPTTIRRLLASNVDAIRKQWHILVDGEDIPPPIKNFRDMRLPKPILKKLKKKGIVQSIPIQVQGLPIMLSSHDMISIAFTSSGKTLVFVLVPLIMVALQKEVMMLIMPGEGPFGLIICPSRELARQTYEVVEQFLALLREHGYPKLRLLLCIGGVDIRSQLEVGKKGVHIVMAMPGGLKDLLARKKMNLDNCRPGKDVGEGNEQDSEQGSEDSKSSVERSINLDNLQDCDYVGSLDEEVGECTARQTTELRAEGGEDRAKRGETSTTGRAGSAVDRAGSTSGRARSATTRAGSTNGRAAASAGRARSTVGRAASSIGRARSMAERGRSTAGRTLASTRGASTSASVRGASSLSSVRAIGRVSSSRKRHIC